MTNQEEILLSMYMKDKRKKNLIVFILIPAILIIGVSAFFGYTFYSQTYWTLKQSECVVEYGEEYIPRLSEFADYEKSKNLSEENTIFKTDFKINTEKGYAEVGEYNVELIHQINYSLFGKHILTKDQTKTAKIIVKDTTAPVFSEDNPKEIYVFPTSENIDMSKCVNADDLSGVKSISIKGDDVDLKTPNTYSVECVATDIYDNSSKYELNIVVDNISITLSEQNISLEKGKDKVIKFEVGNNNKCINYAETIKKAVWKSSDEKVATVNNGKIFAVAKGKCDITLTIDDFEVSCFVDVSEPVVEKRTEKKQKQSTTVSGGSQSTTQQTVIQPQKQQSTQSQKKQSTTQSSTVYKNKDFLFTDGYTMENVADAAYAYLKASGRAGSCIPIKNSEGVYLGMRVVFD